LRERGESKAEKGYGEACVKNNHTNTEKHTGENDPGSVSCKGRRVQKDRSLNAHMSGQKRQKEPKKCVQECDARLRWDQLGKEKRVNKRD